MTEPLRTRELLKKYGIRLSKKLGQNFLLDEGIIQEIVEGANVGPDDVVVEVGPGLGVLTHALTERARRVLAIELDRKLIPVLKETLGQRDNLEIIQGDALKVDLAALTSPHLTPGQRFKVVANLPYYITTPLVMHFLESRLRLSSMTIMVQREVAERMMARPGGKDYGALSVAVQYSCHPERIARVPPGAFLPPPSVDSMVIRLTLLDEPAVSVPDERFFFRVVRSAFGMRRKTLVNALSSLGLPFSKQELGERLSAAGIEPKRRGETLSLQEFARLALALLGDAAT